VSASHHADQLREAGLRATRPRLLVLAALEQLGGHRSADELVATLDAQGTSLPRQSVYNVLESLVAAGLVLPADAGPGRALFEAGTAFHHHFVCRECGVVQDVSCVVGVKPCLDPRLVDAEVDEAQVIFRGRCPACVQAKRRA
jgi:Fur family ferric uptake transcriptional regulator